MNPTLRFLSYLTTLMMTVFLAACGGGGGSSGTSLGSTPVALSTTAPATLILPVGISTVYSIKGGTAPYSIRNSDAAIAQGWISGDALTLGTVAAGNTTVAVVDDKGAQVAIAVTVGSSTAFYSTLPTAFTIGTGVAAAQTFKVGGGVAPYSATSNNGGVATVALNGSSLSITGLTIGNATVQIRDAAGTTLSSLVTVGTVALAVNPKAFTMFIGDVIRAIITGGTPPYRTQVAIDETLLSVKIINGNELEAVGGQVSANAGITVIDANNQSVSVSATITNGQDVLRVSPNVLSIPESSNTPNLTLNVYGASAGGSIQVFSSDPTVLAPSAPVAGGTGYVVKLTGGNTCSLTVTPGTAAVTGPPFVAAVPATGGNRVVTITVLDTKGKVGTSTITVSDTNGASGC